MPQSKTAKPRQSASPNASKTKVTNSSSVGVRANKNVMDYQFLFIVILLLTFGLIMVFSASFPSANFKYGNGYYFINKQLIWAGIGVVAMFLTANIDYHVWGKLSVPILITSILLLILVIFIGRDVNGAKRQIFFGQMSFQPSELAKLAMVIYFSYTLSIIGKKIRNFKTGLLKYLLLLFFFGLLLLLEPHFSAFVLIALTACIILIVAGARIYQFALLSIPAAIGLITLVIIEPYRWVRITSFLNPTADKLGDNWQIIQSLYAIGSGAIFGLGFASSRQKFMYIPEPQNDFIFSIICEELGLIGAILVIGLFAVLIWRGMKTAMAAPDSFGCFLVVGIMSLIGLQVMINIAVVTSSMPVTGMPLPFFSAGGSSLVFVLAAMGMVLNVSRYTKKKTLG